MKKKTKLAAALALMSFLAFGGSAWAQGQFRTIEVYMERVNIAVNGQMSYLSQDSIIYDGSVYVPLRNLSEMLGAKVEWDDQNRAVNLNFLDDTTNAFGMAATKGLYQYIALENNRLIKDMTTSIKNDNTSAMRGYVDRYQALYQLATNMQDYDMAETIDKIKSAIVLIQSGWKNKKMDDYYIATSIYADNVAVLNAMLKAKLSDSPAAIGSK
ncbi:copper amine oxidase N-terminal domain-containing protein [Paenibacillus athensensis]|uniref:Copper amine oxidase-like N-terminal domain-containing protein n=1 Tax=Paenibacillus athensensis TaxID=1967502 RepID=A0A4Y8Q719_9BACL|nr:copper amine oxidase N-terminal domain-containing protein [Paenibacillus athensensis]MCD1257458.1 copper amine oxidase N-terminal domain-containing protein [Paenibacillus athensensis]